MKNKDRLYIVLYARSGAPKMPGKKYIRQYLPIIHPQSNCIPNQQTQLPLGPPHPPQTQTQTPSPETGTCYSAKEILSPSGTTQWHFQETPSPPGPSPAAILLVRVMVAKVRDTERLRRLLRGVPVREDEVGWNCVGWVRETLETVRGDGRGEVLGRNVVGCCGGGYGVCWEEEGVGEVLWGS